MKHHEAKPDRILRRPEVKAATGLTDSVLEREIKAGRFPAPFKLLPDPRARAVGWSERAVQAWIAERIAAAQNEVAA